MAAKKITTFNLAELIKRVPSNQIKQFEQFHDKSLEYQRRVNQYPEKLPTIDWEYYRNNVRKDYINMVEQFQIKYEELNRVFLSRHEVLDYTTYFKDLEQLKSQVHDEVKRFIEESNYRVKIYQDEMRRIKSLRYENMTLEEFIEEREDVAMFIPRQGKALFWPHNAEEQLGAADQVGDNKVEKKKEN